MKDIKLQVPGGYLDIDTNIGFGVSYSVDDVKDISKRNTASSKTITLQDTKNNHKLMGMLFDVKSDFTAFNPNYKTTAKIIVDSTTIIDGFLQLKNIKKLGNLNQEGNEIKYETVIFSDVIDFYSTLGDNLITELSFSANNHTYDKATIEASWSNDYTDVYTYPLLYNGTDIYTTKDFKPSIFHYNYITKIFDYSSTKYGGTIFSDPTFLKEIIPYNGPLVALAPDEFTRRNFMVSMSATTEQLSNSTIVGGVLSDTFGGVYTNRVASLNTSNLTASTLTDEITSPNFDPNNHWNIGTQKWEIDANGSYNWESDIVLDVEYRTWRNDIVSITGTSGGFIFITFADNHNFNWDSTPKVTLSGASLYNGTYTNAFIYDPNSMGPKTIRINGITHTSNLGSGGTLSWEAYEQTYSVGYPIRETSRTNNGQYKYRFDLALLKNGTAISPHNSPYIDVPKSTGTSPTFWSGNSFTVNQDVVVPINRPNLPLLSGDTLGFNIRISSTNSYFLKYSDGIVSASDISVPVLIYVSIKKNKLSQKTYIKGTANASPDLTDGDTIQLSSFIPQEVKMKDMLGDLIKRYNLYISTDPNDKNKILLDTRDAFYSSSTQTLDWTQLKDYSVADKIEFISELQNKEILWTYKKDSDVWNKNYTESTGGDSKGDVFGQKKIEFDNEFAKGQKKIELSIFSPTPGVSNSVNNRFVVPAISTLAPKSNIRVLLYNGLKAPINTSGGAGVFSWTFNWYQGNVFQSTNYLNYPQALHQDDVFNPTQDINFGQVPWEYYTGSFVTDNNLYNKYWKNYIEQISEGRLVTSRFYLTEIDVNKVKNSFNTKVFCGGDYYYINKIVDFDPTNDDSTEVQLLKIAAPVVFSPTNTTGDTVYTDYEAYRLVDPKLTDITNTVMSKDVIVLGKNNYVGPDADGSIVLGDDNNVSNLSKNSLILGTGITANQSGYIYLENATIDSSGQIYDLTGSSISSDFCTLGIKTSAISGCSSSVTIYDSAGVFAASFSGTASVVGGVGTNSATTTNAFVGGGKNNLASGPGSFIGGGGYYGAYTTYGNIASGNNSAVVGGLKNISSYSSSFIGGGYGNLASTIDSAIIGGILNTTSGLGRSSIIGGQHNRASGTDSLVGGGVSNSATTDNSSVIGGQLNLASGSRSSIVGGSNNIASTFDTHIGGGTYNVASGQRSAVIGGYANSATTVDSSVVGGKSNQASGVYSFVGGGLGNTVSGYYSSVVGGENNIVSGSRSMINGGYNNLVSGQNSIVGGGFSNSATTTNSSVVGGRSNIASGVNSTVVGGKSNLASGNYSSILGGMSNTSSTTCSFIGGGRFNTSSGNYSSVIGGLSNSASGDKTFVAGGTSNIASGGNSSVIGGSSNLVSGISSFIGGGVSNIASGLMSATIGGKFSLASGPYAVTIGGGYSIVGDGISATTTGSIAIGGITNISSGLYSSVIGGGQNNVSGDNSSIINGKFNTVSGVHSSVVGGIINLASGNQAVVVGGRQNLASGENSSIIGGSGNTISGTRSVILGGQSIIGVSGDTVYVPSISFKNENISWIFKEIELGDWDMESNSGITVAHNLSTEWKTIRDVKVIIRNDGDTEYNDFYIMDISSGSNLGGAIQLIDSTNFTLERLGGVGTFFSPLYNSTSYNRGWITFWYKPDAS